MDRRLGPHGSAAALLPVTQSNVELKEADSIPSLGSHRGSSPPGSDADLSELDEGDSGKFSDDAPIRLDFPHIAVGEKAAQMAWRPYRAQREAIQREHGDALFAADDASDDLGEGEGNIFYGMFERRDIDLSLLVKASTWERLWARPIWIKAYLWGTLLLLYFSTFINVIVFVLLTGIWYGPALCCDDCVLIAEPFPPTGALGKLCVSSPSLPHYL